MVSLAMYDKIWKYRNDQKGKYSRFKQNLEKCNRVRKCLVQKSKYLLSPKNPNKKLLKLRNDPILYFPYPVQIVFHVPFLQSLICQYFKLLCTSAKQRWRNFYNL